jgi:hypothetical protein
MLLTHCHNDVDEDLPNFIAIKYSKTRGRSKGGKVEGQNPSNMLSKKMLKPLPT